MIAPGNHKYCGFAARSTTVRRKWDIFGFPVGKYRMIACSNAILPSKMPGRAMLAPTLVEYDNLPFVYCFLLFSKNSNFPLVNREKMC